MVEELEWLDADLAKQRQLPQEERIEIINGEHWIGYSKAQQGVAKMDELIHLPKRLRMPNLLILSPTNNGKTMLVKKFMRNYPPQEAEGMQAFPGLYKRVPVLYLQMPSSPNLMRFYALILQTLNYQVPSVTRLAELEILALKVFSQLEIKMLVIDELHNILAGSASSQREFLNLLRFLGNKLQIPIVALGTKDAYLAIRSDDQLENRFEPFILPKWQYDQEYLSLLSSFSQIFPIKLAIDLTEPALARKILEMCDGKIGEISTLVKKAVIWAIRHQGEYLNTAVFDKVDYQSPAARRQKIERELNN